MGGTQSSNNSRRQNNYEEQEDVFVNENMRKLQDDLSSQPKREMPLTQKEINSRGEARRLEYKRKKKVRSARINNISRQWAESQMANSSIDDNKKRRRRLSMGECCYQKKWCCCELFP